MRVNDFKYSVLLSIYKKETPENLSESLSSMLHQTIFPDEIVMVKDGILTPALEEMLNAYDEAFPGVFHFVNRPQNGGLGVALQDGVLACHNEWIARMDTDDISARNRIEVQANYLIKHPEVDMIGSNYYEFIGDLDHKVLRSSPETHKELERYMHKRNPFGHDSLLFRKSKVLEAGNYQNVIRFEDYDLWIRMNQCGTITYNIQKPLLYVRGNSDFYNRRGGWQYLKQNYEFFNRHRRNGFFTWGDCIKTLVPRTVVCLMPSSLRTMCYTKLLRKSVEEDAVCVKEVVTIK